MPPPTPDLPVPISYIQGRYLLFSITAVSYFRREHNICGVLTGSLPQIPQQNVFLGLPLELMPEEAKLVVERGVAYIVDDVLRHNEGIKSVVPENKELYIQDLRRQGGEAALIQAGRKEQKREKTLQKLAQKNAATAATTAKSEMTVDGASPTPATSQDDNAEDSLFEQPESPRRSSSPTLSNSRSSIDIPNLAVTPATSELLLPPPTPSSQPSHEIKVPASYPLFAHLHSKGHFISPGLRFGCQYMVYPGDPLRFHSHFLTNGYQWDEEIDLMDLVGGGRLGTGVKKAFLIGGKEENEDMPTGDATKVRAWSIEWAGM